MRRAGSVRQRTFGRGFHARKTSKLAHLRMLCQFHLAYSDNDQAKEVTARWLLALDEEKATEVASSSPTAAVTKG